MRFIFDILTRFVRILGMIIHAYQTSRYIVTHPNNEPCKFFTYSIFKKVSGNSEGIPRSLSERSVTWMPPYETFHHLC